MNDAVAGRPRLTVTEATRIRLPRHVKLRWDESRSRWVILVPERVLAPDDTAVEILKLIDGNKTVGAVIDELHAKYSAAPREDIAKDVVEMLQDLADKDFLAEVREEEKNG